jgi:hypothetical protein
MASVQRGSTQSDEHSFRICSWEWFGEELKENSGQEVTVKGRKLVL